MSPRRREVALLACGAVCTAALPAAVGFARVPHEQLLPALLPLVNAIVYLGVAGYAVWRRPMHRAAQRMVVWAVTMTVGYAAGAVYSAAVAIGLVPGWGWAGLVGIEVLAWLGNLALVSLFLVFPDGSYRRPLDRAVIRWAVVALAAFVVCQLIGQPEIRTGDLVWSDEARAPNPWAVPALSGVGAVGALGLGPGGPLLTLIGALLLLLRWRGSEAEDRRRIAWPLVGFAATGLAMLGLGAAHALLPPWPAWLQALAWAPVVLFVPIALVVGIVNGQLLDIGVVVSRSVVYGALWMAIAVAYLGLTAAAGVVAGSRLPLAMAVATTVLVGFVSAPARRHLERLADRLVFGRRAEGDLLLGEVGRKLARGSGMDNAAFDIAESVREGVRAEWVVVRLADGDPVAAASLSRAVSADGAPQRRGAPAPLAVARPASVAPPAPDVVPGMDQPRLVAAIEIDGVHLGEIRCGSKLDGAYTDRDALLVETLGRQAAWALRNVQLSRELTAKVDELQASRVRILQAEEAGRRRLERDLHDGVQQELVALLARLGLAANQLRRGSPLAAGTIADAHAEARTALEDLQEVVRGIHPTLLADRGLVAAVEARAVRMPVPVAVSSDEAARSGRFTDDVESSAYFVVSECLTNVAKHAPYASVAVTFRLAHDLLHLSVTDDGPGFDVDSHWGSGLTGLQDRVEACGGRLDVSSRPGMGTTITAELPTSGGGTS
ncbi:sensor histidine kinase [Raineyella fluvialis]|uniref:Oxygen sensor histidine kinase NreB n=1 Tax=Raineyella fluvialis TaxID=2662261 RepID=A0A5Q2F8M2_9ACTN|nr:histidine kinase [Raineyella fluvialis]QGF23179.1 hypothetical protein Rai3103_05335 [Raineyella fluvialis]